MANPSTVPTVAEPTVDQQRRVADVALRAQAEEREIIRRTTELRDVLDRYRRTTEVDLPALLNEIGQSEFKLLDGTPVALKSALRAGQLSDYGEDANLAGLDWVLKHGGRPLVRTTITVEFDAEDYEAAEQLYQMIRRHPTANRQKDLRFERRVVWNTLTKWVGQLITGMRDPPLELLGVRRHTFAQVGKSRPKTVEIKGFVER